MNDPTHGLVGTSAALGKVLGFIDRVGPLRGNVLLEGENGTGKELVSHALHRCSLRAQQPFVAINCAALPKDTLENELFGHEKEAYTGATSRRKGQFELADGGTLFLDEIGEIGWNAQAKLLRAVEYGEIRRIGGDSTVHVDVRVIAATNQDLRAAIARHQFREDLYYRLHVLPLRLPPLRERREDIPILTRHFIADDEVGVSAGAEDALCKYAWPGNVRQLKHVLEGVLAFLSGPTIQLRDLPDVVFEPSAVEAPAETLDRVVVRAKREFVEKVMQIVEGNFKEAGRMLGKHPAGLSRLLDSLDLSHWKKNQGGRYEPI